MASGVSGTKGNTESNQPVNNLKALGELPAEYHDDNYTEQWMKENTNVPSEKLSDTAKAVRAFTSTGFWSIREAQLNNNTWSPAGERGVLIEDYIKQAPQWNNSKDLHRGVKLEKDEIQNILNDIKAGKAIDVNHSGTASWSTKYDVAEGFAYTSSMVPVIFRAKKMKNATTVMHISKHPDEHEVLSSKDNRFKAVKVRKKKINGYDGYLIDVEPV